MSKTVGFYFLEKYFWKCDGWPTSQGLRGLGPTILGVVNIVWILYPLIMEIIDYKVNVTKCLFHVHFVGMGALCLFYNVQLYVNRHRLFEMIDLFSDFTQFGIPQRIKFVDKYMKIALRMLRYGGFLISHLLTYYIMSDDSCSNFKNTKHCLILEYYVPFDLKPWSITLIMLFQINTAIITTNILFLGLIFYCYSLELLIVRIEHLNEQICDTNLTRNRRRNFLILHPIVLYHQHMFRLFQFANNFFTNFLAPTKIFSLICLTMSTTEFVMRQDIISIVLIIINFLALFVCHTIGQRFTTAASSISKTVYDINWYDADVPTRKDVLMLFSMCQKELTLELPLFGKLSHTAAANEYKKVYAFYNWILTVLKQRNL